MSPISSSAKWNRSPQSDDPSSVADTVAEVRAVDSPSVGRQPRSVNLTTRPKFSRSKDGCLTCRKRRKRCDLTAPRCKACLRLHLTCSWPGNILPVQAPQAAVSYNILSPIGSKEISGQWTADNGVGSNIALPPDRPSSMGLTSIASVSGGTDNNLSLPATSPDLPMLSGFPYGDLIGLFDLDETTLQLWAADCMLPLANGSGTLDPCINAGIPSGLLCSSLAGSGMDASLPTQSPPSSIPSSQPCGGAREVADTIHDVHPKATLAHSDLLRHFQSTLSKLVSCSGDGQGFNAFTALADKNLALYLSILAWAGRHLANSGQPRYEAISERLGAQAGTMVSTHLEQVEKEFPSQGASWQSPNGLTDNRSEMDKEYMTLLAAALMVMQFRICRGDVWGFDVLTAQTGYLAMTLFERVNTGDDPMAAQFFDNLIYHDVLCSFAYTRGSMLPYSLVERHTRQQSDRLHTLTGATMPVFCMMYRLVSLIRQRRLASVSGDAISDEILVDVVRSAEKLEEELEDERQRIDRLVIDKPDMETHRYLHEAFRTASLIQIRGFVLCEPPCSLKMRLLVRQSLSLLEIMTQQGLPGLCSIHWVLFITAVCAVPGASDGPDDRERVDKLYGDFQRKIAGFLNVPRSRRLVREVWANNQEGRVFYDWLDIVAAYDWEIFMV